MRPLRVLRWLLIPLSIACFSFVSLVFADETDTDTDITENISISEAPAESTPFTDVEEGDYHYLAITELRKSGLLSGYPDGTFKADNKINRAEALTLIMKANKVIEDGSIDIEQYSDSPFPDVNAEDWFHPYVLAAKEKSIIHGHDDGLFHPESNITLAAALKIYIESLPNKIIYPDLNLHLFADTPENAWFTKYTAYADSRDLLIIHPGNDIYPDQEISRGYLAEIIYRMIKFSEGKRFGKATFYGEALQGNFTASGEIFDYHLMTAAHKELPFGTMVKVTNMSNGQSITVKINDRGPYGPGRVIDLSKAAFDEIAWLGTGVINAQLEILKEQ